jgi:WD40 repeat protein
VPTTDVSDGVIDGLTIRSTLRQKDINKFAWSPDGNLLAIPSSNWAIAIWDRNSAGPTSVLEGHSHIIRAVAWSPDSRLLASASDDRTIRLWQMPTGKHVATLEGHTKVVLSLAWSKDRVSSPLRRSKVPRQRRRQESQNRLGTHRADSSRRLLGYCLSDLFWFWLRFDVTWRSSDQFERKG